MFIWTEPSIKWMDAAAERTGFYDNIAALITKKLPANACVCDIGCGTGLLSAALSPHVAHIDAVDISDIALDRLAERGLQNVSIIRADAAAFSPDTHYDAAVFCYYGSPEEIISMRKNINADKIIAVQSGTGREHFAHGEKKLIRVSIDELADMLESLDIAYTKETADLEFGQPFRSIDDAIAFFSHYRPSADITPEYVEPMLRHTGDAEYPLYSPSLKRINMLVFGGRNAEL